MPSPKSPAEPKPLDALEPFEPWDFEALSGPKARSDEFNEYRLRTRRKLLAIGKAFAQRAQDEAGATFDVRSSIHNPHMFNGKKVDRLWIYVTRPKAEKARLKKTLGAELAKDLDQAYKNLYLCAAVEPDRLEVSLRIHPDGWYDGQNLKNRTEREGLGGWLTVLNTLDGFQLRLHDWKGEWRCGALNTDQLAEFLRFYTPGEHQLVVDQRWPVTEATRPHACTPEVPARMVDELLRLVPLFRYAAWSEDANFLFGG